MSILDSAHRVDLVPECNYKFKCFLMMRDLGVRVYFQPIEYDKDIMEYHDATANRNSQRKSYILKFI